ncbi:MAG: cadherin-like beta sandwich domain-containing protein [Nitrospira sp.]|nr:cadherin-like beta sandwich domain-containing protein [Nitrospira sp.]MDH4341456.1 cadherin-like beta sandwich domain-containing protein [Nitrospira sp.]MDH5337167.1 cadherin-like beta sandwich domain-containing protein [Nitrospira sp.]
MHRTVSAVGQCLVSILSLTVVLSASGCKDTGSISEGPQVRLSSLSVSEPGLQPAFSSAITNYTLSVLSTVASVTVTATPESNSTNITIDGTPTRNRSVDLNPPGQSTAIPITLTEQSGSQSSYILVVHRDAPLSGNNALSNLTVSSGSLTPGFSPGTLNYTVDVATGTSSLTITAAVQDSNASLMIDGQGISSGQSREISPLAPPGSDTLITILVRAPSGAEKTYRITVKRPLPSSDAALSALTVSAGTLDPSFPASTSTYTVTVPASVDSMTVTATKSDANSVMSSLGSVIALSGVASGSVSSPLGLGTTTEIMITVRAQDGVTTKTYTIKVSRASR